MTTLEEAFRQIRSENSKYSIKVIELEREITKLKLENDKYQDIIQAKVINESFLEADNIQLREQLKEAREIIKTSLGFNGIKTQIEVLDKAKAWLENNK